MAPFMSVKIEGEKSHLPGGKQFPAGSTASKITDTENGEEDEDGNFRIRKILRDKLSRTNNLGNFNRNGLYRIETSLFKKKMKAIDYIGMFFDYPEEKCIGVTWMGRGPYRGRKEMN